MSGLKLPDRPCQFGVLIDSWNGVLTRTEFRVNPCLAELTLLAELCSALNSQGIYQLYFRFKKAEELRGSGNTIGISPRPFLSVLHSVA